MEAPSSIPLSVNPEPNIFLPRGRIGVRSMLVQSIVCHLLLLIVGLLVRQLSVETGRDILLVLVYALIAVMLLTGIKRAHDMDYSSWAVIHFGWLAVFAATAGHKGTQSIWPATEKVILTITRVFPLAAWLLAAATARAQLAVTVSPVKVTGSKAVVKLELKNTFAEKVESARAVCFLFDEQGKVVGQATRWVIGGSGDKPGLAPDATNAFHFVITPDKGLLTTNLTVKLTCSRLVIEGGKQVDPNNNFQVHFRQ